MTFTQVRLSGHRVLVRDNTPVDNETVLDSAQWDEIKERRDGNAAEQEFGAVVEEFFKPLTDAAEKLQASVKSDDEEKYFVIEEPVAGKQGKPGHRIELTHDSKVLRILEQGENVARTRLVWVGGTLEITEAVQTPVAAPASTLAVGTAIE